MSGPLDTAMVLAAGLGLRMRPLTNDRPKPLIEVAGKTLLDHTLDRLAEAGVTRAVVNMHYCADQIERHVARRAAPPQITLSDERERLLETGGGLAKAAPLLGQAPIWVSNTDQVFLDGGGGALKQMAAAWDPLAMDALLLLVPKHRASGFEGAGDFFRAPDGRLARRGAAAEAPYIYTGMQILHPRVLSGWPVEPFSLNRVWDVALDRARLFGFVLDGDWMHVGDPLGLAAASERLEQAAAR